MSYTGNHSIYYKTPFITRKNFLLINMRRPLTVDMTLLSTFSCSVILLLDSRGRWVWDKDIFFSFPNGAVYSVPSGLFLSLYRSYLDLR